MKYICKDNLDKDNIELIDFRENRKRGVTDCENNSFSFVLKYIEREIQAKGYLPYLYFILF